MAKPIIRLNIRRVEKNLIKYLKKKMLEVVVRLDAYAKNSMTVSNAGGTNPSAPGNTPNIGTGTLKRSITHKVGTERNAVVGVYGVARGPASAYARRLELGFVGRDTKGRLHNQLPRPFIKPAYQKNKRKIKQILTR